MDVPSGVSVSDRGRPRAVCPDTVACPISGPLSSAAWGEACVRSGVGGPVAGLRSSCCARPLWHPPRGSRSRCGWGQGRCPLRLSLGVCMSGAQRPSPVTAVDRPQPPPASARPLGLGGVASLGPVPSEADTHPCLSWRLPVPSGLSSHLALGSPSGRRPHALWLSVGPVTLSGQESKPGSISVSRVFWVAGRAWCLPGACSPW